MPQIQFKERWLQLNDANTTGDTVKSTKKSKKVHKLLRELSSDEDDAVDIGLDHDIPDDPQRPWLQDYQAYMNIVEQVPDGWTAVKWWGVSLFKLVSLGGLLVNSML